MFTNQKKKIIVKVKNLCKRFITSYKKLVKNIVGLLHLRNEKQMATIDHIKRKISKMIVVIITEKIHKLF